MFDFKIYDIIKAGLREDKKYEFLKAVSQKKQGEPIYLPGANLSFAIFNDFFLYEAILQGSSFALTTLTKCKFKLCDFSGSNFFGANIYNCEFLDCDLSGTNMSSVNMHRVKIVNCKFEGSNFSNATIPPL